MAAKDSGSKVTLLNGSNYAIWKVKMKCVLFRDEIWDTVEAPKPEPVTDAWKKANNKAMARLMLAIEDDQVVHVGHLQAAHDVWSTLQKMYERSTLGSQLYLRRKLYTSRFVSGTMRAHITSLLEVVSQLRNAGTNVVDGEIVAALLASLPESYSGLVTALEGRDEAVLTVDYVTGKMLDEYQRRTENSSDQKDSQLALQTTAPRAGQNRRGFKGKKEIRECFFCHKPGHLKADCHAYKKTQHPVKEAAKITGRVQEQGENTRMSNFCTFTACERASKVATAGWLVDSGATSHMTMDETFFTSMRKANIEVCLANKSWVPAAGIGTGQLNCSLAKGGVQVVQLKDVLYVPELDGGLLSVSRMTHHGFKVVFEGTDCTILNGSQVVAVARGENNLFKLDSVRTAESARVVGTKASLDQWHRRMGHRDKAAIKRLCSEGLVTGLELDGREQQAICENCVKGKLARLPFPVSTSRAVRPLDLIHSDVCGPMPTPTPSGNRYVLTLIDDHSRFTVVQLLRHKSEVTGAVKEYFAVMSNKFGRKPKILRTDNGKEYVNHELCNFLKVQGTEHQLTVVHTPEQNGVAERKNRSLTEMAKCMLLDSGLHNRFWGEAVLTATYLQNRLPSRSIDKTPFELWHASQPDISHIRVFGSKVFSFIPKEKRRKWDDRAEEGVLIGYSDVTKGYRILDPKSSKVWVSRTVRIIESEASIQQLDSQELPQPKTVIETERPATEQEGDTSDDDDPEVMPEQPVVPPVRVSQRSTKGIPPRRYCHKVEVSQVKEPSNWDAMMQLPLQERRKWMAATEQEMKSLREHHVWELADLPAGRKAITSKWVFKAKLDAQGQVHTHKARLVARGFSQQFGQDYDETFAPVVKHETVRVLLAVAASHNLHVRHLDVKCAYLNGELEEELYMEQPQGFEEPGKENKVLRLKRSLYGLKQSARAWNKMATETLNKLGFQRGQADQCLFSRKEKDNSLTYILLYVDDLLVVGTSAEVTKQVGKDLNQFFQTKDLGNVTHYLGIQVEQEVDGSFLLHQGTKIAQMLEEHGIMEPRPAATPMETGFLSSAEESPKMPNNNKYRQAIGSLLYLATVSRPDIAVAVGFLCRRVEAPTESDWKSVKRVMRYLATTINRKLRLSSQGDLELRCYADADWAGDRKDRKSTSGYVFQLGYSTVAWSSRKQTTVALSSTEAEYLAASHACRELLWLRQLLVDLGVPTSDPTVVYEDNQGCIKLVESDRCGSRTKHIDVCHHLLRDLREQGKIALQYCPTESMIADILTKPLCKELFGQFVGQLGLQG